MTSGLGSAVAPASSGLFPQPVSMSREMIGQPPRRVKRRRSGAPPPSRHAKAAPGGFAFSTGMW